MIPENVYKPVFGSHNLPRYNMMQNALNGLITDINQHTVHISMAHLFQNEIIIYIKHILYPLVRDLVDKQIPYNILIMVGWDGEAKMTVLRRELANYCIPFTQETRRKVSIYG